MPPGMKLHQIPPSYLPASSYSMYAQNYAAPYPLPGGGSAPSTVTSSGSASTSRGASTEGGGDGNRGVPTIPILPPAPDAIGQIRYPSQDPSRMGSMKK